MNLKPVLGVLLFSAVAWAQLEVIATGLQGPQKMVLTPAGNLLISESSTAINSGRLSLVTSGGVRRTLLDKLPSGVEVTGGGSGPTALAIRERTLYVALGGGDVERRAERPGTVMHNPQGPSSPLFASVLKVVANQDLDMLAGPFEMTVAHQRVLHDGGDVQIADATGGTLTVSVLARFPVSEPDANTVYRFSNPWGFALTADGNTLYTTDASVNALVSIDTTTGRWQRLMRFAPSPNPGNVGPPVIEAVPTGVRVYGNQVLVSFLSGFPFYPGFARVLAVNPVTRTAEPFINGLTSAVDVAVGPSGSARPSFFALEFSVNQSAQPAAPGRLLRFDTPEAQVVAADLRAPVSLAYDSSANLLYVLELTGRVLRLRVQ
ncbi:MAG: ScyD/ScyE family protein [Bryobacteraceae bacterium]|nr:ScyD/ScyE family protein [Bryobacteraceae bacterium]